jgi:signal transduction histidine kinase/CheY-like chemotaxis protein
MTTPDEPVNILVVDDLPDKLLVYRTILGELNQNVITVGSGEDALRAVLAHEFAVILLDVHMPGMSGLETAALIRQRKRSAHTPIIFVTAFADEVRATEGYAQGAVDYIKMPVIPAILRAKVRVFVDLYRMNRQVQRRAEERIALAEERTRREAAEEANRRLAFLANVGAVLGSSLDQEATAADAVRLATSLADEAALVVFPTDGRAERVVRGWAAPAGPAVEAGERSALAPELAGALARAAEGRAPATGPETVLAVPLLARGRVFAALGLVRFSPGAPYSPADVAVAETLASRAAMALENARLYRELQETDRQKNEFLSMLAHELRNPLAPIRNANEVIRHLGHDPGRVRWAHGVIDRQITHLVRLVDDLLDVSRLTLGKIRLTVAPVDLKVVAAQAVEAVRPLVDQVRHQLEVTLPEGPVWVTGDSARLVQVFANLLNNAAKYTEPGGRIWLTVTAEHAEPSNGAAGAPGHVVLRVRDTGVGIAPELLPNVFELFIQATSSLDRSQGGLGVGLTLVRRLVDLHGGTVEAHSAGPGRGSEFVVRLPGARAPGAAGPEPAAPRSGSAPERLRVVVVDDNVDGVESLADLIQMLGHEVRIAHDGPTGLAAARAFDPDIVLLDIGLPGMDGYEVARRLRREPAARAVLVAISGYGREEDLRESQRAGFVRHFVKPVDFSTLRALFEQIQPGTNRGGERE